MGTTPLPSLALAGELLPGPDGPGPTGRLSPRLPGSLEETQVTTKAVGIFGLFFLAGCGVLAVGFRQ